MQTNRRLTRVTSGAFLAHFAAFGLIAAYGALLREVELSAGLSRAEAALILSLPSALLLFLSAYTGRLADRFGAGRIVLLGATLSAAGLALPVIDASASTYVIGLGVLTGLGGASLFVPSLVAVDHSSSPDERPRQIGFAAAGTSVGIIVEPLLVAFFVQEWSRSAALVALGFLTLGAGALGAMLLGMGSGAAASVATPEAVVPLQDAELRSLRRLRLAGAIVGFAYYVPLVHLPALGEHRGLSALSAAGLVAAMGAANLLGRATSGPIGLIAGLGRTLRFSILGLSITLIGLGLITGFQWLLVLAILYGTLAGAFVVLYPARSREIAETSSPGLVIGRMYQSLALGAVLGPVAVGILFDASGSYDGGFLLLGCVSLVSILVLTLPSSLLPKR